MKKGLISCPFCGAESEVRTNRAGKDYIWCPGDGQIIAGSGKRPGPGYAEYIEVNMVAVADPAGSPEKIEPEFEKFEKPEFEKFEKPEKAPKPRKSKKKRQVIDEWGYISWVAE